jgi:polyferredoxin
MSKTKKKRRTKINIDYSICGEKGKIDPRDCGLCLRACDPAVFVMHTTIGTEDKQEDPYYPYMGFFM